ncbi:hypothetical protein SEA_BAILEYBLU_10 [Arthrobacter phage BaileyBlu]|uniref:Uncharacterized protein n=1 Tax=Arthrobacter phage BaileyBlu TaxID=2910754 RepID=A0AA49GZT4_9CAUD|nr:hypothetical protein PQD78_gp10 [Arthrobacter phage BaileyBlu]UJQ87148.1 hypothetical protein SEA_BAILEYBLU_10 [Arthrobacter phage BaileyBlu]
MIPKGMKLDKVVMSPAQRRKVLKMQEVEADLARRAKNVRDAAGGESKGYSAEASNPTKRARAAVFASGQTARRENARGNTLLRALDAGRR